jgi:hypothetical protein
LCIAERDTVSECGIEDVCKQPWELAFRGKVAVLFHTEVEVVVLILVLAVLVECRWRRLAYSYTRNIGSNIVKHWYHVAPFANVSD